MKKSTIIKIDINGFHKKAVTQSTAETCEFLQAFYEKIEKLISSRGWRLVKTIGDCILIEAEKNIEFISKFYLEVISEYQVSMVHRVCEYEILNVKIGTYSCEDIVGKDINRLFLCDSATQKMV